MPSSATAGLYVAQINKILTCAWPVLLGWCYQAAIAIAFDQQLRDARERARLTSLSTADGPLAAARDGAHEKVGTSDSTLDARVQHRTGGGGGRCVRAG